MRKVISLGLFALMLSIFSSQVFAGKIADCEDIKKDPAYKGLYGLCNAYWNEDDEDARAQILANFVKKAGTSLDEPGMPGWKPVVPDLPDLPDQEVTCPCWDFDTLVQVIACSSLLRAEYQQDSTDDQSSLDFVAFARFDPEIVWVAVSAGYTDIVIQDPDAKECSIETSIGQISMGEGKVPYKATSENENLACRLDVLDLIAVPPVPDDCEPQL